MGFPRAVHEVGVVGSGVFVFVLVVEHFGIGGQRQ